MKRYLLFGLALAFAGPVKAEENFDLKFSSWVPPAHAMHAAIKRWGDSIAAASKGTTIVARWNPKPMPTMIDTRIANEVKPSRVRGAPESRPRCLARSTTAEVSVPSAAIRTRMVAKPAPISTPPRNSQKSHSPNTIATMLEATR